MKAFLVLLVAFAAGGALALFSLPAGASTRDTTSTTANPQWCVVGPDGVAKTATIQDTQGLKLIFILDASSRGGSLWVTTDSAGNVYGNYNGPNDPPAHPGDQLASGATVTSVTHYTVTEGACGNGGHTTNSTTTATTTETTPTTTVAPPPPAGPMAWLCESKSARPVQETKKFAKTLWDRGNAIPYAAKGNFGKARIGEGYSLVCNPAAHHLVYKWGRWVNDHGAQVHYLDLGHYPVATKPVRSS